jgi:hypothetical protein
LTLLTDGNWKTRSTVATVGENPSAKGRLPHVYFLTKIPLKYYPLISLDMLWIFPKTALFYNRKSIIV